MDAAHQGATNWVLLIGCWAIIIVNIISLFKSFKSIRESNRRIKADQEYWKAKYPEIFK